MRKRRIVYLLVIPLLAIPSLASGSVDQPGLVIIARDNSYTIEAAAAVVLRRGRAAFGTIRDQAGNPVKAARVTLVPREDASRPLSPASSDPSGGFRFEAVTPGSFNLVVRAPGFAPLTLPNLFIPAGVEPWDLGTAFLSSGAVIEGRVLQKDGSAVPGAHVRALSEETEKGHPSANPDAQVTTDEEGRFTLIDQIAGIPCRLEVTASGFSPVLTPAVVPPASEPVTVVLASSSQISGTVLAGGSPVEGAVVVAALDDGSAFAGRRFYTTSNADGSFLLQDLEPGPLLLSASAEGYAESRQVSLVLPAGERRDGIEIHLEAGSAVSGTVSSKTGGTVGGATIEAFAEASGTRGAAPVRRTAVSDPSGRFRLTGLQPGSWLFRVSHTAFAREVARHRIGSGEISLDFILDSGSEVSGKVTDAGGAPVPGAQILLSPSGGDPRGLGQLPPVREREAVSQADGSFRFTGLEDGSYSLQASKAGLAPAEPAQSIAIAGAPIEGIILRLDRGGSVSGRLLGLSYDELARTEIFAFQTGGRTARGEVNPAGGYRISNLAPGQWHIAAEVEETGKRALGQVAVGEEPATLDLDLTSQPTTNPADQQQHDL